MYDDALVLGHDLKHLHQYFTCTKFKKGYSTMFVLCMCEFINNSKTLCMANTYCQSGWGGGREGE